MSRRSTSRERRWVVRAEAASVPRVRGEVAEFAAACGVPDPPLADLRLALSEALTNVVVHGYRDRAAPGEVDASVKVRASRIEVVVGDRGVGLAPRRDSPGMGLGMPLIASVAQSFEVRSRPRGGTEIHFSFDY